VAEQPKLCPLSFAFYIMRTQKLSLMPGQNIQEVKIGFPCLKEKCNWWCLSIEECIVWEILRKLNNALDIA